MSRQPWPGSPSIAFGFTLHPGRRAAGACARIRRGCFFSGWASPRRRRFGREKSKDEQCVIFFSPRFALRDRATVGWLADWLMMMMIDEIHDTVLAQPRLHLQPWHFDERKPWKWSSKLLTMQRSSSELSAGDVFENNTWTLFAVRETAPIRCLL